MATAFLFHQKFLEHDAGEFHPENPKRLLAILHGLKEHNLWDRLMHVAPVPASEEEILLVHTKSHFDAIREYARRGSVQVDPDTHVSAASFDAALLAAGAAIRGVRGIMEGEFRNAFAAVRPPGHHATQDRAMGFCLFNNIAVAARFLVNTYRLKRVLIVDWDVHHGNGTQDIFYDDPSVIYVSLHKANHYPGTGFKSETGGPGASETKINRPLTSMDPEQYETVFRTAVEEARKFSPEFILISCGFDAHELDPLGNLGLKSSTYGNLTDLLMRFASEMGHTRVFSILEGGYVYSALAESSAAHVGKLLEVPS
jgi:acetoin utilization deacetylase AcuC-like enzyme